MQRPLPDNTLHSQETAMHLVEIQTPNPRKRAAATHTLDIEATAICD